MVTMVIVWFNMVYIIPLMIIRIVTDLLGGIPSPLKNYGVSNSWDIVIPNIWKNKTCSKPPTSYESMWYPQVGKVDF